MDVTVSRQKIERDDREAQRLVNKEANDRILAEKKQAAKELADAEERKLLAAKDLAEAEERRLNATKVARQIEKQKIELGVAQKSELLEKENALSKADKDRQFEFIMKTLKSENKRLTHQLAHEEHMKSEV